MPWTGPEFQSRHNHSLTAPQAAHAARIGNAILRTGAPERVAIATANKMAERDMGGGILGGGIASAPTPSLQNYVSTPPRLGDTQGLANAATTLAQRQPGLNQPVGYVVGGGVGGISPSATSSSPILKNIAQRYATLPTEKLTELSSSLKGSPQGQVINALLTQRRTQPNAGGAMAQPAPSNPNNLNASLQPNPATIPATGMAAAKGGAIKKPAGAGIIVRSPGGELLFLKRGKGSDQPGTWCFPGGHLEKNETPEQAARREFSEETGYAFQGKLHPIARANNGYATFAADIDKKFTPERDKEHTEYHWAKPEEAPQPLHPGVKAVIDKYLSMKRAKGGAAPHRDMGGGMATLDPSWTRNDWRSASEGTTGFLGGHTLGRQDAIQTRAPSGSYIIPADVVSGLGEGNSLAGARVMQSIVSTGPFGTPLPRGARGMGPPHPVAHTPAQPPIAKGGGVKADSPEPAEVRLSDGEYAVHPEDVRRWGRGNITKGHRIFDQFVLNERKKHIKKLKSLPGPVKPGEEKAA